MTRQEGGGGVWVELGWVGLSWDSFGVRSGQVGLGWARGRVGLGVIWAEFGCGLGWEADWVGLSSAGWVLGWTGPDCTVPEGCGAVEMGWPSWPLSESQSL